MNVCTYCNALHADAAAVCLESTNEFVRVLRHTADLLAELDVAISLQAVTGPDNLGIRSGGKPLPLNVDAAAVRDRIAQGIAAWDRRTVQIQTKNPFAQPKLTERATDRLIQKAMVIRLLPEAASCFRRIISDHEAGWKYLEGVRDEDKVVGRCGYEVDGQECGHVLYAQPGAVVVECPKDGSIHDVNARQAWMLATLQEQLVTLAQAEKMGKRLEFTIPQSTMSGWIKTGKLEPVDEDMGKRSLYRFGDIVELRRQWLLEQSRRAEQVAS